MILIDGEEALTVDEAAAELRLNRATFYRYVRAGRIAKFRHGGRTYVFRRWIKQYWQEQAQAADTEKSRNARAQRARRRAS